MANADTDAVHRVAEPTRAEPHPRGGPHGLRAVSDGDVQHTSGVQGEALQV
jgi:hypothetical protein